jgi:hypothetical protein
MLQLLLNIISFHQDICGDIFNLNPSCGILTREIRFPVEVPG